MHDHLRRQLGQRLDHPDAFAWLVDQLPLSDTSVCLRAWGCLHGVYPTTSDDSTSPDAITTPLLSRDRAGQTEPDLATPAP